MGSIGRVVGGRGDGANRQRWGRVGLPQLRTTEAPSVAMASSLIRVSPPARSACCDRCAVSASFRDWGDVHRGRWKGGGGADRINSGPNTPHIPTTECNRGPACGFWELGWRTDAPRRVPVLEVAVKTTTTGLDMVEFGGRGGDKKSGFRNQILSEGFWTLSEVTHPQDGYPLVVYMRSRVLCSPRAGANQRSLAYLLTPRLHNPGLAPPMSPVIEGWRLALPRQASVPR